MRRRDAAASDLAPLAERVRTPAADDGTADPLDSGAPAALAPPLPPLAASPAAANGSATVASVARPLGATGPAAAAPATLCEGPTGGKQGTTRDLRKLTLPELKTELCALGFDPAAVAATDRWALVRQLQGACNLQVERLGSNAPQKLRDWARLPRKTREAFPRWSEEEDAVLLRHVAAARATKDKPNMRAAYNATVAELGASSGRSQYACRTRWQKELKKKPEHAALARMGTRRPGAASDDDDDDDDEDDDEEEEEEEEEEDDDDDDADAPDEAGGDSQMSAGGAAAPALSFKAGAEGQPDDGSDADSPIAAGPPAASAHADGAAMQGSPLAAAAEAAVGVDGDDAAPPVVGAFLDLMQPAALRCADAPLPRPSPSKAAVPVCDRIRALERHLQESRARTVAIEGEYRRKKAAEEVVESRLLQQLHAARAEEQEEQARDDAKLAQLRAEEAAEAQAAKEAEEQAAKLLTAAAERRSSAAAKAAAAQDFAAQVDKKRKRED